METIHGFIYLGHIMKYVDRYNIQQEKPDGREIFSPPTWQEQTSKNTYAKLLVVLYINHRRARILKAVEAKLEDFKTRGEEC